ncbi:MAG: ketoacyl-ACP synthase III [Heliobacteriaceae bacterium]|nr:ketoacyl-ACP synthase III [Heliobacteriaceae bacterium]MDD4587008.1 ketoacyl-ACP synthase III [Heliobacteriaceae bacterium]
MVSRLRPVGFWGTGSYLPEKVLSNRELETIVNTSDEWIINRTGIRERRQAAVDQATSDLAVAAGRQALAMAGVAAEDVDLVIVATCTPDAVLPATACVVAHRLGAVKAAAFDLAAACTGFVYGTAVGAQFVATGVYDKVLVIGAEVLTRVVDYTDRNTCVLFGDGAGAALLGPVAGDGGIKAVYLRADGAGDHLLQIPAGGSRLPADHTTVEQRLHFLQMNGREVFRFAVKIMAEAARQVAFQAGWQQTDIQFLVPHQANQRIIDAAIRKLGINREQVVINLERYGNISAASVPVALDEAVRAGRIREGDRVVLVGFGSGLTWGSLALQWAGSPLYS